MTLPQDFLFNPSSILSWDRPAVCLSRLKKPWIRCLRSFGLSWTTLLCSNNHMTSPNFRSIQTELWDNISFIRRGMLLSVSGTNVGQSNPNYNEYDIQIEENTSAIIGDTQQCLCRRAQRGTLSKCTECQIAKTVNCMTSNHALMSAILVIWKDTATPCGKGIWTFCACQPSHIPVRYDYLVVGDPIQSC
jgi:hypothetical protein